MRVKLTDRFCTSAKEDEWIDETVSGLTLRVSKTGVKAWTRLYKVDGKLNRLSLGRYPELSLAAARGKALETKSEVAEGGNPKAKSDGDDTLRAIYEGYVKRKGDLRSLDERCKLLERCVLPGLGHRPIAEIKRSEIVRMRRADGWVGWDSAGC